MAVLHGKNGNVQVGSPLADVAAITEWTMERTNAAEPSATSDTSGAMRREPGIDDATGSFSCMVDVSAAPEDSFNEGDDVALRLYESSTRYWGLASVIITKVSISAPINGSVTVNCDWGNNGAITPPS